MQGVAGSRGLRATADDDDDDDLDPFRPVFVVAGRGKKFLPQDWWSDSMFKVVVCEYYEGVALAYNLTDFISCF